MPDDQDLIEARLGKLGLEAQREEEILRELSEHLADHAKALEASGTAADAAARQALDSVSNWPEIRAEIVSAETEEAIMNHRTKVLWLPALCALTLSNGCLALMQIFNVPAHFYQFGIGKDVQALCEFIVPWIIAQAFVGALAAYWSRSAGGTLRHQLLAALAPAIALLGVFVLILPVAIVMEQAPHHIQLYGFLILTVTWVVLPAIPLLLGAAPFLRKPLTQSL
ncbi:MAG: hypothetical protein ACLQVG_06785 [Terriglobia bacterium]